MTEKEKFMREALKQAKRAYEKGEIPVGAVIVKDNKIIARAYNEKEEKKDRKSAMDGISKSQSALMSAQKISKRAVKQGFEWPNEKSLYECIQSEINEFKEAEQEKDFDHMEEEYGDILFAIVNLARWNKIDAEQALLKANKKFMTRFRKMEELAIKPLTEYSFEEFDKLWKSAKKALK